MAQVSILRPGFLLENGPAATPRSQKRDLGHPLIFFCAIFISAAGNQVSSRKVFAEDLAQTPGNLAYRGAALDSLEDRRHKIRGGIGLFLNAI